MKTYKFVLVKPGTSPPAGAVSLGYQNDGKGKMFTTLAMTKEHGCVPGKTDATGDVCTYATNGHVYETDTFYWLKAKDAQSLFLWKQTSTPSRRDLEERFGGGAALVQPSVLMTRGRSMPYPALAITAWGIIPGWVEDSVCFYAYNMEEMLTPNFYWLVALPKQTKFNADPKLTLASQTSTQSIVSSITNIFSCLKVKHGTMPRSVYVKAEKLQIEDPGVYEISFQRPAEELFPLGQVQDMADFDETDVEEWRDGLYLLSNLKLHGCIPMEKPHTIATQGCVKLEKFKRGYTVLLQIQNGQGNLVASTTIQEGVYFGSAVIARALILSIRTGLESVLIHTYKDDVKKGKKVS